MHTEWIELPSTNHALDRSTASYIHLEYIKERQLSENPQDHVHLALYFISPHARELSSLDLECLKFLTAMTSVILVIGRAEILLPSELQRIRGHIASQIQQEGLKLFRGQVFTPGPLSKLLFTRYLSELIDT